MAVGGFQLELQGTGGYLMQTHQCFKAFNSEVNVLSYSKIATCHRDKREDIRWLDFIRTCDVVRTAGLG